MQITTCDLSACFLCTHCLPEWKEVVALRKQTLVFKRGELLFKEGVAVQGIFFLLSGAVKVHRQWEEGKELIIRFAGRGSIVGHRGGLGGIANYPVSATALEGGQACFIPTDFLTASLKANQEFAYQLLQFYATELQLAERRMSELAHMDVKGRIASALLALQEAFGTNVDSAVNVLISRQDIAGYAGSTYETVFKVFTEWISNAIIKTEGKRIHILNEKTLREAMH